MTGGPVERKGCSSPHGQLIANLRRIGRQAVETRRLLGLGVQLGEGIGRSSGRVARA